MAGLIGLLLNQDQEANINQQNQESPVFTESDLGKFTADAQVGQGEISEDLLSLTADPVFENIGLTRFGGESVMTGNKPVTSKEQELTISQPTKFGEFLDECSKNLSEFPVIKDTLGNVYNNLLQGIELTASSHDELDEETREEYRRLALDVLDSLQPKYINLQESDGLKVNLDKGLSYLNWGRKDEFDDFIKSRDLGLREAGTFSATEWHLDSSGESYSSRWGNLFSHYDSVVKKFGSNNDLALHIKFGINDALKEASDWSSNTSASYGKEYMADLKPSIEEALKMARERGIELDS